MVFVSEYESARVWTLAVLHVEELAGRGSAVVINGHGDFPMGRFEWSGIECLFMIWVDISLHRILYTSNSSH
jgi:hypothetical protein